jgi:hypothetical protein
LSQSLVYGFTQVSNNIERLVLGAVATMSTSMRSERLIGNSHPSLG